MYYSEWRALGMDDTLGYPEAWLSVGCHAQGIWAESV
jgi:hypothetical protein